MKTDTREYTDGTEPDVYRRWCCDGQCQQGKLCPKNMPAEAATDIGQDDPDFYSKELLLKEIFDFAMAVVIVGTTVVVVSYLAGRFL
jgi:hypothetical protein